MGWFGFRSNTEFNALEAKVDTLQAEAHLRGGFYRPLLSISFDGEKNLGELGAVTKYHLDYQALRYRSWESYLSSEITQTVINKQVNWVIGNGLKLQSEPVELVLQSEGINNNKLKEFSNLAEARFKLFTDSKKTDYSHLKSLQKLAKVAYKNAKIGGDCLTILRLEKGFLNVQLVDGSHIKTPLFSDHKKKALERNNTIVNGVELDSKGRHVAYYVQVGAEDVKRILAKESKHGREMAFLVYGSEYRIDDNRGLPVMSGVLEALKKLDRYKEAAVGTAEETAKVAYTIEHESFSTGENPLQKALVDAHNVDSKQDVPLDVQGKAMAKEIAISTTKQVFNMPNGAKLNTLDTSNNLHFKEFYGVNFVGICAAVGIPPEVALGKYDSNFSASRAALKDWEHTLQLERKEFSDQFYQKIYNFWLDFQILFGKLQAPGYLLGLKDGNDMVVDSYRNSRFVGAIIPHIDPLKEVQAERLKLGTAGAHLPLTTAEAATEALNGGASVSNMVKFGVELAAAEKGGIVDPKTAALEEKNTIKKEEE